MTDKPIIKYAFAKKMNEVCRKMKGHTMKDKLETLSIILIFAGMILGMNGDETHLYTNFIGIGIAALGMVILHVIGRDV